MQACLLIYDIPEEVQPGHEPIENPSGLLRRIAVRVNLSCWVIPEGNIPYTVLHHMQENGATWHVVKFDVDETPKLLQMCISAIRSDIRNTLERARQSMNRAGQSLLTPDSDPNIEELRQSHIKYCKASKAIVKRLRGYLADMEVVSGQFGIPSTTVNLPTATQAIFALQSTMQQRARMYVQSINQLSAKLGQTNPVVRTAKQNGIPAVVMADYMDDNGMNGKPLRDLFD
jgi:hypothetical protein